MDSYSIKGLNVSLDDCRVCGKFDQFARIVDRASIDNISYYTIRHAYEMSDIRYIKHLISKNISQKYLKRLLKGIGGQWGVYSDNVQLVISNIHVLDKHIDSIALYMSDNFDENTRNGNIMPDILFGNIESSDELNDYINEQRKRVTRVDQFQKKLMTGFDDISIII